MLGVLCIIGFPVQFIRDFFEVACPSSSTHICLALRRLLTVCPGGVRTTIAMHCGCKIVKMAAKVEKFRGLYALFFNRYSSFLRSFFSVS